MKKIVLIGASGFVGTNLIDILGAENCLNIDKAQSEKHFEITVIHDIRNQGLEKLLPKDTETVVLLAAEHRDDVRPISLYYDVNVEGTKNVLNAMDKCGIKNLIFTSSAAVYGLDKENPNENFPKAPFSHYGKSKLQAENELQLWLQKSPTEKSLTLVRSAVIFGPNNKGNVHNLLMQIASGKFMMIGKGNNKKSMVYVENAAAFLKYCIENTEKGLKIFNYVDYPDLTTKELVGQVEKSLDKRLPSIRLPYWLGKIGGFGFDTISWITGKKFAITGERIKKFCATTQIDATAAHNTGFKAPYTIAQGLDITLKSEFQK